MGSIADLQPGGAATLTPPDPMLPRPFLVRRVHQDTRDTYTLELEPTDGAPLAWLPGQFTMLHAFGVGEAPISISGDPSRPDRIEHTVRNVGSVTAALVTAGPGTVLGVRGPFGTGWDVGKAEIGSPAPLCDVEPPARSGRSVRRPRDLAVPGPRAGLDGCPPSGSVTWP